MEEIMGFVRILDNSIWAKHVEEDDELADRILSLEDDAPIVLHIDGEPVLFRKMRTGKDGRAVSGIRPDASFKDFWNSLYSKRRGEKVSVALGAQTPNDSYLASTSSLLSEWDSPADNAAYNDL
jgi:hypothetical protein